MVKALLVNSKKAFESVLASRSNVIVYKEKEKLEHPERNLSEKRRLNPAKQTQPKYRIDAGTRMQATLL